MPKHKLEATDFDLECSICPKQPQFSDISHLLTHIESKAHLSVKHNLFIRGRRVLEAKQQFDDYNLWEEENGLLDMLVDRLDAKDIKKSKKRKTSVGIKKEKKAPSQRESPDLESSTSFRAPAAMMHPFPTQSNNASTAGSEWEPSMYDTPTTRRQVPNFSRQETPSRATFDPMLTTPRDDEERGNHIEDDVEEPDSSKLKKGIQWPGMDVFDSASAEGKRMRNQRKNGKVLQDMINDSMNVEPAEISYHANGAFRGARDIYSAAVSIENSPVQETRKKASPKKRKTRGKATAMGDVSTNAPRLRQNTRNRNTESGMEQNASGHQTQQAHYQVQPPNPLAGYRIPFNPFMATAEENEEFGMTFGSMVTRRPLTVHRDAPEISPARTESPLEEPRFDFPNHGLMVYPNNLPNSAPIPSSPTPAARPNSFHNTHGMHGATGGHGRNGQGETSTQFHARRTLSASHVYPPQAFQYDSNPLFGHSYTRSYAYGGGHSYMVNNAHDNTYENNIIRSPSGVGSSFSTEFRSINPTAGSSRPSQQAQDRQAD